VPIPFPVSKQWKPNSAGPAGGNFRQSKTRDGLPAGMVFCAVGIGLTWNDYRDYQLQLLSLFKRRNPAIPDR
jgi:hypothetical protein